MNRLALWYLGLLNTFWGAILFFALMPVIGIALWTLLAALGAIFSH